MKRNIVIGPPGTGKTTFLKNKVDKLINEGHCKPDEIGYFSFTVKAAETSLNEYILPSVAVASATAPASVTSVHV